MPAGGSRLLTYTAQTAGDLTATSTVGLTSNANGVPGLSNLTLAGSSVVDQRGGLRLRPAELGDEPELQQRPRGRGADAGGGQHHGDQLGLPGLAGRDGRRDGGQRGRQRRGERAGRQQPPADLHGADGGRPDGDLDGGPDEQRQRRAGPEQPDAGRQQRGDQRRGLRLRQPERGHDDAGL